MAVAYYELVLPCLAPRGVPSLRQVLDLALLVLGFSGIVFLASLLIEDAGSLDPWWQTADRGNAARRCFGRAGFYASTVYGRALAIVTAPTLRRNTS